VRLFGEWRVRSYLLIAESMILTKRATRAFGVLDLAEDAVYKFLHDDQNNPALLAQRSIIKRLREMCEKQQTEMEKHLPAGTGSRGTLPSVPATAFIMEGGPLQKNGPSQKTKSNPARNEPSAPNNKKKKSGSLLRPFKKLASKWRGRKQPLRSQMETSESEHENTPSLANSHDDDDDNDDEKSYSNAARMDDISSCQSSLLPPSYSHLDDEDDVPMPLARRVGAQRTMFPSYNDSTSVTDTSVATTKARGSGGNSGGGSGTTPNGQILSLHVNRSLLGGGGDQPLSLTDAGDLVAQMDESLRNRAKANIMVLQVQLRELQHMLDTA